MTAAAIDLANPAAPAPEPGLAIDLSRVSKIYRGKVHALRDISLKVAPGEIFGLLGPNGAGKSTLVKILMTVIRPTRAEGAMLGRPIGDRATLARVGYLPEHHRFPDYLTGAQVLDHYAAMSIVPRKRRRLRAAELLETVNIAEWAKTRVRGYSKGMRQRLGIAQALINDPQLVVLDEPTDGVDPVGRREIRQLLMRLRDEGRTVFLNSHLLSELEMVCDRVAILVQGRVAAQGTIDDLTRDQRRYDIDLAIPPGESIEGVLDRLRPVVTMAEAAGPSRQLASGQRVRVEGSSLRIDCTEPGPIQPLIDALRGARVEIVAIRPTKPTLEDLFMRAVIDPATGRELKPGADLHAADSGRGAAAAREAAR